MRNPGLDLLRLVAIGLVLGRHGGLCSDAESAFLHRVSSFWETGGWIGVDLFFVLSGFLVSGLLFHEYKTRSKLDVKRFLIRRGFKIYPPFLALIAVTLLVQGALSKPPIQGRTVFAELFFLQNYLGGIWNHTWSLAVEEHFYLSLAVLFYVRMQRNPRAGFDFIPKLFLAIAGVCLGLRLLTWALVPRYAHEVHLFPTHLRVDSLFYGVCLSYFHHFRPESLPFFRWRTSVLMLLGGMLLLPAFVFPLEQYLFVSALGVIGLYVGSGFLLIVALRLNTARGALLQGIASLGAASYSIYLWHMPVKLWGLSAIHRFWNPDRWTVDTALYLVGSALTGYAAALLVERPLLAVRDRLYPSSKVRAVVVEAAVPQLVQSDV